MFFLFYSLNRDLHVGVCASFDSGKTPNFGTLSPQDILLKDQNGNILPSLFYNIEYLAPGEVIYLLLPLFINVIF